MQPSIFVSHGAPNVVLVESEVRNALKGLAAGLEKPDAIIIASAHFETGVNEVVSDPNPGTMYDFGGFDPQLYEMVYPAPGAPQLAQEVLAALKSSGLESRINPERDFDHGVWTPLMLAFPAADIPVVQVSVQPHRDAAHHHALGKALGRFRERNILVMGSGHITHNLREVFPAMQGRAVDPSSAAKVTTFVAWIGDHLKAGDTEALLDWERAAPHGRFNHPTPEHFMPLFVAYGAGANDGQQIGAASLLHRSTQFGVFTSDIWRFD